MESIAAVQIGDGLIPWFPGGHADPWNHVEAAMALGAGGRIAEAERAFEWLAATQRADGAWHQYYLGGHVKETTLDANVTAYVATGAWHHFLVTGDTGFLAAMWPVVEAAMGFVLALQTPGGEILWARHSDGTPWPYALLTASSSTLMSLRGAISIAGALGLERPAWEAAAMRLEAAIVHRPDAFAPKSRFAMDWYYPVLVGAVSAEQASARLAARRPEFVMDGRGVRCVSDRPWVTTAETCECAIAHAVAGEVEVARRLLAWTDALRDDDGSYFTGMVHPDRVHFPGGERTTYSAAAVVLATAMLLRPTGPTGILFGGSDEARRHPAVTPSSPPGGAHDC